jgi:predicted MFS family arabinose efflux permease
MPYLVVHVFGIRTFSSVMGLLTATISLAITIGAIVLSITLKTTGHFTTFLTLSAVSVLIGGLLFLLIRAPVHGADETPVPAH